MDLLHNVVTLWEHTCKIQLLYLLPLIVAECRADQAWFEALSNMRSSVEDIRRPKKKWLSKMIVEFSGRRSRPNDHSPSPERVKLFGFLVQYMTAAQTPITTISHQDGQSHSQAWLREQFQQELTAYGTRHHTDVIYSYSYEYPRRVRSVGRFIMDDAKPTFHDN